MLYFKVAVFLLFYAVQRFAAAAAIERIAYEQELAPTPLTQPPSPKSLLAS